jgi:hypothetical protein
MWSVPSTMITAGPASKLVDVWPARARRPAMNPLASTVDNVDANATSSVSNGASSVPR